MSEPVPAPPAGLEQASRGLADTADYLNRQAATFPESLRPAAEAAERALRQATTVFDGAADTAEAVFLEIATTLGNLAEQAIATHRRAMQDRIHRLAAGTLKAEERPDTRHSVTAYRAGLTAHMIARRAVRSHLMARHPGGLEGQREAAAERHRVLVETAWNLYLAAAVAGARGDTDTAGRHLEAVSVLLEATQAAVSITTHRHHRHRPRRALGPPGRRCAALHLTAQAPPMGLPRHTSDMAPHGSARPPG